MEIKELDQPFDSVISPSQTTDIATDGITIRTGNKIVHLTVTSEETIPEDDLKADYDSRLDDEVSKMEQMFNEYKESMRFSITEAKNELEFEKRQYEKLSMKEQHLPELTYNDAKKGLTVSAGVREDGYVWYYTCVYSPKYINKRQIEPSFAKRLLTPIVIEIQTDSKFMVNRLVLKKVIGHGKFHHYHSLSDTSDCWGGFDHQGEILDETSKVFTFVNNVLSVLEVINEYSLGRANPKGLSRIATLRKHLLPEETQVMEDVKKTNVNSRNTRAGFDQDVNDNLDSIWTT